MRRRRNRGRHVQGPGTPERVPWWDVPGVATLLIVGVLFPSLALIYMGMHMLVWGVWPSW